jgi:hypothetical protein
VGWTCTIDGNPSGFCLIISSRAVIAGVAISEIMHGFGLCADPVKTLSARAAFPANAGIIAI